MATKTVRKPTEQKVVYNWRVEQLRLAGFTKKAAEYHADSDMDLNSARLMAGHGCGWRLIVDIIGEKDVADVAV